MPVSYELFLQAIIQSDPFTADYKFVTQSLKNGEEFAQALGKCKSGSIYIVTKYYG